MGRRDWPLYPPPSADQKIQDCHWATSRNIDNDYRRCARKWADPEAATEDQVKLAAGTILDAPREDAIVPESPQWPASRRPRPCAEGFTEPSPENKGDHSVLPNTQAPKRSRATEKDVEFTKRHRKSFREAALCFGKSRPGLRSGYQ